MRALRIELERTWTLIRIPNYTIYIRLVRYSWSPSCLIVIEFRGTSEGGRGTFFLFFSSPDNHRCLYLFVVLWFSPQQGQIDHHFPRQCHLLTNRALETHVTDLLTFVPHALYHMSDEPSRYDHNMVPPTASMLIMRLE